MNASNLRVINPLKKTWVKSPKKQRIQVAKNKSPKKNMGEITQKTTYSSC